MKHVTKAERIALERVSGPDDIKDLEARAKKLLRRERKTTKRPWRWSGKRLPVPAKGEKGEPYVPQGSYLGGTSISLADTYENSREDCAYVEQACNDAPMLARALLAALRENARLGEERDEARTWVRRLTAEARVLTCVYCGHAYPPGTPEHGADLLTAHVKVCEKHPMREVELEKARLMAENTRLREENALLRLSQTDHNC